MEKQFTIGVKTYTIKEVDQVDRLNTETMGQVVSPLQEVLIATLYRGEKIPKENKDQTLYHEITHAILDEMGEHDLSCNETFVQGFSLLLHQVVTTLK